MAPRTQEQLLEEIRNLILERNPVTRAMTRGKLYFLNTTFATEQDREYSPLVWIMEAQIGILDKLAGLFAREGDYETFDLLASARNLFENLVWLRLFNKDYQYGLVFYEQLLKQRKQYIESLIAKVSGEVELFDEYDKLENENFESTVLRKIGEGTVDKDEIQNAYDVHRAVVDDLDKRVRRAFALYAADAQFNGYGYQNHILRETVIPSHRSALAEVQERLDRYLAVKSTLLSAAMLPRTSQRWNWRERAIEVGMCDQYQFLYSYTSKLLHSTPMNLITEKALLPSEAVMILDYAFVTIHDLLDEIDQFSFPGAARVLMFDV